VCIYIYILSGEHNNIRHTHIYIHLRYTNTRRQVRGADGVVHKHISFASHVYVHGRRGVYNIVQIRFSAHLAYINITYYEKTRTHTWRGSNRSNSGARARSSITMRTSSRWCRPRVAVAYIIYTCVCVCVCVCERYYYYYHYYRYYRYLLRATCFSRCTGGYRVTRTIVFRGFPLSAPRPRTRLVGGDGVIIL